MWRTMRACWHAIRRWSRAMLDEADEWRTDHGDPSGWGG